LSVAEVVEELIGPMRNTRATRSTTPKSAKPFSGFMLLPRPLDTREREAHALADLAKRHAGILISASHGEGRTKVARGAAALAGLTHLPTLNGSRSTSPDHLRSWFKTHSDATLLLLRDADTLTPAALPALEEALDNPRTCVLMTCAPWLLEAPGAATVSKVADYLREKWQRRYLAHLTLGALEPLELALSTENVLEHSGLDTLQVATIFMGAHGSLALAADLAADAAAAPERVPRHVSAAWNEGFPLSTSTRARLAQRFSDLPEDLIAVVSEMQRFGTIDADTASLLLGHDVLSRLLANGLAVSTVPGAVGVDYIGAAAWGQANPGPSESSQVMTRLERAYRFDDRLPPGCLLALADRRLLASDLGDDADLFVSAARAACRLGQSHRALKFARVATSLGAKQEVLLTAVWTAKLQLDRHKEVLDEAETFYNEHPDRVTTEHTHVVCVAASWLPSLPEWLCNHVDQMPDRDYAETLDVFLEREQLDLPTTHRLHRIASDPSASPALRQSAFAMVLWHHLSAGHSEELPRLIERARTFAGSRPAPTRGHESTVDFHSRLIFNVMLTAARLLSGTGQDGARQSVNDITAAAVDYSADSGSQTSIGASFVNAVNWYVAGDIAAAERDLTSLMQQMDRSVFRSQNVLLHSFCSLIPDLAHGAEAEGHGRNHYLTRPYGVVVESRPAVLPGWMHTGLVCAHTQGLSAAALSAVERYVRNVAWVHLPSAQAARTYFESKLAQDPHRLRAAVDDLLSTGQMAAALDALNCAKELYLSRRSASAAMECEQQLQALSPQAIMVIPESRRVQPTRTVEPIIPQDAAKPPAGLSEREFQVCLLISEGLSNAELAQRLVLSVRTVESHVLQARSKLNAKRRTDLPDRLREAWAKEA
jgi:DNA-binding NarL/FixJ family response regulator